MTELRALVTLDGQKFVVEVDKLGGGTRGRSYEGAWSVSVWHRGARVLSDEALHTGTPKTHREVAQIAAEFALEEFSY